MKRLILYFAVGLAVADCATAEVVHVFEEQEVGGVVTRLSDTTKDTGAEYATSPAPAVPDCIFTHWSTSAQQDFESRDQEGRAWDAAPYRLYETTTLTAHYVPASLDEDGDGVADGHELYWYGSLDKGPSDDTDGDGYTFAQELAAGTNPHFPDETLVGGVVWDDSDELLYNPHGYAPYTVRSEPEGALFETTVTYAVPGSDIATPACDWATTDFAYWTMNGSPVRDEDGRAVDCVSFSMPDAPAELVAVCAAAREERAKLYWYGTDDIDMSGDSDNDGYSFEQELAAGTNPHFPDATYIGGVVWADSPMLDYNPHGYHVCVVRSEPEGALFASVTNIVATGDVVATERFSPATTAFAHWTVDGVVQRDEDGRALDALSVPMPPKDAEFVAVTIEDAGERMNDYWYGGSVDADCDTDGDGYTFAQELAAGTNPHFPDATLAGGIAWRDTDCHEVNLQPYEQCTGAWVDGTYEELFTSPTAGNASTGKTFGRNLQPVVADVNGDALFDIVLVYDGGVKVLVNVGSNGNPEFEERMADLSSVDLAMNSTDKLGTLELDVAPVAALSATTWGGDTLLVSDAEGRIWYYRGGMLQHKVWGGSHAGFANGLRLAAVDWDDDGDLDCLCGTAEGKLMLLKDPNAGRPTNLRAMAGVDNVLLTWDPNAQSRIRGYRVYRADGDGIAAESGKWDLLASPSLPTYRDYPPTLADYGYAVSSVSRFYTAGNSTPIVTESPTTEALRVSFGKVALHWTDVAVKRGETVRLMLSIDNSVNLSSEGMSVEIKYDREVLKLLETVPSGLFDEGGIAPGGGKLYEYVFEVVDDDATDAEVSVAGATMYTIDGAKVPVTLPEKAAAITIAAPTDPVPYRLGDVNGDGVLDKEDQKELARLKNGNGQKPTADQIKAGDFNGNGELDNADYQALKAYLKELKGK